MSLIAKAKPVAVLGSTAVGDQSTVTLEIDPPLPEVIPDFVNPMTHAVFAGSILKVGKVTGEFDPPIVKSEVSEVDVETKVGGLGHASYLTTSVIYTIVASPEINGSIFHVNVVSALYEGAVVISKVTSPFESTAAVTLPPPAL